MGQRKCECLFICGARGGFQASVDVEEGCECSPNRGVSGDFRESQWAMRRVASARQIMVSVVVFGSSADVAK